MHSHPHTDFSVSYQIRAYCNVSLTFFLVLSCFGSYIDDKVLEFRSFAFKNLTI